MSIMTTVRQPAFWDRLGRFLLPTVLVIALAWVLAQSVWLWWQGPMPVGHGDFPVIREARQDGGSVALSEARVRQWELFGPLEVQVTKADPKDAPETRLRLELLGVFQHPDPSVASAIIAEQGKDASLYHPGDRVPGNATLEEVYADQVILNRMGQREALKLKLAQLAGGGVEAVGGGARREEAPRRQAQDTAEDKGGPDLLQQRVMIVERLGLELRAEGGYTISGSAPADMLAMVGLRPGDVIVSVNGHTLGDQASDMAALEDFRNTGHASIVVERGDQRFTVNYPP